MGLTEILVAAGILVPVAFFFATARLMRRSEEPNPKLADKLLEGVRYEYEQASAETKAAEAKARNEALARAVAAASHGVRRA